MPSASPASTSGCRCTATTSTRPPTVVEWVKGTSLTRFRTRLDDATYEAFLDRYRARLLEVLGDRSPYFYTFKRILFWGRLPRVSLTG